VLHRPIETTAFIRDNRSPAELAYCKWKVEWQKAERQRRAAEIEAQEILQAELDAAVAYWRVAALSEALGWPILSAVSAERVGLFHIRFAGGPSKPFNRQPLISHLTNSNGCGILSF
jgi:hypothetical protein